MIGTRSSRVRSEQRLLAVWQPRIGRDATLTARQCIVWQLRAYLLAFGFLLVVLPLVTVLGSKNALTAACALTFAALIGFLVRGLRLQLRASAQAAEFLGVSHKQRHSVPVRRITSFDAWAERQPGLRASGVPPTGP